MPLRDQDGRIVKWFGTSTDIDEIKRLERERAHAVEVLEHGDPCIVVDRDSPGDARQSEQRKAGSRASLEPARAEVVAAFPEVALDSLRCKRELERASASARS